MPSARTTRRYAWLRRIEALDPVADHHEIHRITAGHEFPWDYQRSLELALYRTYCVPSISALLDATGEFANRPQRRYDDTALLIAEIAEHGYDSPRGREALRVINRAHGRFRITQEDMRYVLTTFIYDPIDWIDEFGWRQLSNHERIAAFHFYREVGKRLGIRDIPTDYAEFRQFKVDYEHANFRYSETNHRIGVQTRELMCSWYWPPVRPLVRQAVHGLLSEQMLTAFDFPAAPTWLRKATHQALRARSAVVRHLPPRTTSRLSNDPHNRTYPGYPNGYHPRDLGAPPPTDIAPSWLATPQRPPSDH
ncbi:oxygenase MpaB family protein [Actinokineospora iranica]|uniref:ER-bound oxygenase mpaB/mpaB'/Rubber oxygenase catalytic domain-containing protein n=1 Tax=Actinokineospora iranica TaxID=1271860 RepID=A0A1G6XD36_9PSEU|nr:oxygenase MpaB family protein [Actinokineospora iranica]SDD76144.1 hypothetical protein SAMN05216174_11746 [Actinokineospora iranica]